jgi:hypothetical protein
MSRLSSFAYEEATPVLLRDGDQVSRFKRALVAGDFFATLDAPPVLGRLLRPADDVWGANRVIVLSYQHGSDGSVATRPSSAGVSRCTKTVHSTRLSA